MVFAAGYLKTHWWYCTTVAFSMSPSTGLKIYFDGKKLLDIGLFFVQFWRYGKAWKVFWYRFGQFFGEKWMKSDFGMSFAQILKSQRITSARFNQTKAHWLPILTSRMAYLMKTTSVKRWIIERKIPGTFDGHMYAFGLTDTISNFVCAEKEQTSCAHLLLALLCLTVTENLSTGVDYNNGGLLPTMLLMAAGDW